MATRKRQHKKVKVEDYTIGVRFANDPKRIFTYKVKGHAQIHLGQELVADHPDYGSKIVYAVRIDKEVVIPDTLCEDEMKFIVKRVVPL